MSAPAPEWLCTFAVGELALAVDVRAVREVLECDLWLPVPLANPAVVGLLNLRGKVMTCVDAHRLLALGQPKQPCNVNLVFAAPGRPLSLVVDAVHDVQAVQPALRHPAPTTVPPNLRGVVLAVHRREGHLLLEIDPERLIEAIERLGTEAA